MSMDYTKPLVVPAGSDALGQIGKQLLLWCDGLCVNVVVMQVCLPYLLETWQRLMQSQYVYIIYTSYSSSIVVAFTGVQWSCGNRHTVDSSHRYIVVPSVQPSLRMHVCDDRLQ